MAKKKLIKTGDRTITVNRLGDVGEIRNRVLNTEAGFALDLIMNDKSDDRSAGAVVARAFSISKLAFEHIKKSRMDTPFPFAKVYGDDSSDA